MGFRDLRCQTPENLRREIAIGVLAYNLVSVLRADTAAVIMVHPREISFSQSRDAWIAFGRDRTTVNDILFLINSASARLIRNRPNRSEPRAIKQRHHTKYKKLTAPRPSKAKRIAAAATP